MTKVIITIEGQDGSFFVHKSGKSQGFSNFEAALAYAQALFEEAGGADKAAIRDLTKTG